MLLCCVTLVHQVMSQATGELTVSTSGIVTNNYQLVKDLLLGGATSGLTITNVSHNRYTYDGIAKFTNGTQTIGFSQGLLLSTGSPYVALGANNKTDTGTVFSSASTDEDLLSIASSEVMHDASVLEFDFIPDCYSFSFRYVFASEEYNEYVCSGYNDVFGFFVFDLDSNDVPSNRRNIALIPGTTLPVAINTVNIGKSGSWGSLENYCYLQYSSLYKNNANVSTAENFGFDRVNIQNPPYHIQYDGFTVPFTAVVSNLSPGKKYRIKLAVADIGDETHDSGVFLEAGSFQSGTPPLVSGPTNVCPGGSITLTTDVFAYDYQWYRNDTLLEGEINRSIYVYEPGSYKVATLIGDCSPKSAAFIVTSNGCTPCAECVPSFSPIPGEKYLLSAWVKEAYNGLVPKNYTNSGVRLTFNNGGISDDALWFFRPQGPVVDGWQRIESPFTIPADASNIQIELVNGSNSLENYFDDIRIHPFQSNAKSFVYDPSSQRLVAELDENNYATQYEYDDEGILIRVKKETERGVMTIKESRNNQSKIFK